MSPMTRLFGSLFLSLFALIAAAADDWPQYRGLHQDGRSTERVFGEAAIGLDVAWKLPLGRSNCLRVREYSAVIRKTRSDTPT